MSNLSDLLPAGAGGKQVDFVASGTLPSGQTVALKTNGQVEAVTGVAEIVGTSTVFNNSATYYTSTTFDSNSNKIVVAYRDEASGNSYGKAVVGTVSGTTISFGAENAFNSAVTDQYITSTYDSTANKVIISYANVGNSSYGTAIVGTVSGTSISFGTAVVFESGATTGFGSTFDSNSNKVVIAYRDNANSAYGTATVGTVSGTSISFGTPVVFETSDTNETALTFDVSNNKVVISYTDTGNSQYGTAIVGTVSGTTISFGTAVVFNNGQSRNPSSTYDSTNNKVVIAYRDAGNSSYGTAIVGTVCGTSISFGTAVVFNAGTTTYQSATFDSSLNRVVIGYNDGGNSGYGTTIAGTVSGTSISFGAETVFESVSTDQLSVAFDSTNNKVVFAYRDSGNSSQGTGLPFQVGATNNTSFLGITDAAISSGASGSVTIKGGISSNVTSLTPNSNYYVQADGTLTTTSSTVLAGRALSSTSINLDYTT